MGWGNAAKAARLKTPAQRGGGLLAAVGRRVRRGTTAAVADTPVLVHYFNGYSPSGQFYKQKVEYVGLGENFHF